MNTRPIGDDPLAQRIARGWDDSPTDPLPQILALLRQIRAASGPAARTGDLLEPVIDWLDQAGQRGAELTRGIPGTRDGGAGWIGRRVVWWPEGVPEGQAVAVASSRLGRQPDQQPDWFAALRTVSAQRHAGSEYLVSVAGTAASEYVAHAAELFGVLLLDVHVCQHHHGSLVGWLDEVRQSVRRSDPTRQIQHAFISPPLADDTFASHNQPASCDDQHASELAQYPLADRILLAMSDQVYVLRLRPKGNLLNLLQHWLQRSPRNSGRAQILVQDALIRPALREDLMSRGALGWYLMSNRDLPSRLRPVETSSQRRVSDSVREKTSATRILTKIPDCGTDPFLVHCTRRRDGPWPDENRADYLDQLLNSDSTADHSPLATLKRIAIQQRLMATGIGIRGGAKVVSFTAVPLAELHRLRVFRPHRGRWDFEPYGLAIRREWLVHRDTQPVRYADPRVWSELKSAERPYFQRAASTTGSGREIDWTVEQEWRHLGDLAFDNLPSEDAFLFVPTRSEAQQIASVSRWPVVAIEEWAK